MKAAVFRGERYPRLEDIPEQETLPGSVRVEVDRCGICGSDLREYLGSPE